MICRLLLLASTAILSACATGPTDKTSESALDESSVTLISKLQSHSSNTLTFFERINPDNLNQFSNGNPGLTLTDGVPHLKHYWCVSEYRDVENAGKEIIANHCEALGGKYEGRWCTSQDGDRPIFMARIDGISLVKDEIFKGRIHGRYCSVKSNPIGVVAVSGEGVDPNLWLSVAEEKLGFKSKSVLAREKLVSDEKSRIEYVRRYQMQRLKDEAIALSKRENAERILASGVGTRICQKYLSAGGQEVVLVGGVDKVENQKIRIAVSESYFLFSGSRPSDFQPSITWDDPINWYPCDYQ